MGIGSNLLNKFFLRVKSFTGENIFLKIINLSSIGAVSASDAYIISMCCVNKIKIGVYTL